MLHDYHVNVAGDRDHRSQASEQPLERRLVLRGDDGRCVGAATRICKGSNCVAMAEALGLREAMEWIEKLKIQNVNIGMDAETIVKAVKT
ncbi:hypothetical protein A2U01_0052471, partial [Trifolium medium]|nr:hypothetical protein [Trifolium medium]